MGASSSIKGFPGGFPQSIFKKLGEGGRGRRVLSGSYRTHFSDLLMVREQDGVTGVNMISPLASGGLGLCAEPHQIVLSFGVFFFFFFTAAKQLRKCASNTIIYSVGISERT